MHAELQETDGVVPIHDAAVMEEVEEQLSNELISELILVVRRRKMNCAQTLSVFISNSVSPIETVEGT